MFHTNLERYQNLLQHLEEKVERKDANFTIILYFDYMKTILLDFLRILSETNEKSLKIEEIKI